MTSSQIFPSKWFYFRILHCCTGLSVGMLLRRWSIQRPNDRYKDHLDRQLTTNMGAKSIGFSSPLSEGYCLQRIIPHYQFFWILSGCSELSFYWLSDISESGDGGLSFFQINYGSLDWLGGYLRQSQMFFPKGERKHHHEVNSVDDKFALEPVQTI